MLNGLPTVKYIILVFVTGIPVAWLFVTHSSMITLIIGVIWILAMIMMQFSSVNRTTGQIRWDRKNGKWQYKK